MSFLAHGGEEISEDGVRSCAALESKLCSLSALGDWAHSSSGLTDFGQVIRLATYKRWRRIVVWAVALPNWIGDLLAAGRTLPENDLHLSAGKTTI